MVFLLLFILLKFILINHSKGVLLNLDNSLSSPYSCVDDKYGEKVFDSHSRSSTELTRGRCYSGTFNSGNLTLFEYNDIGDVVYYDISLVDGYTTDIDVFIDGEITTYVRCGAYESPRASDCYIFQRDDYCCKSEFNDAKICPGSKEYRRTFDKCTFGAYTYAYDDGKGLHFTNRSSIDIRVYSTGVLTPTPTPKSDGELSFDFSSAWICEHSLTLYLLLFLFYCVFC